MKFIISTLLYLSYVAAGPPQPEMFEPHACDEEAFAAFRIALVQPNNVLAWRGERFFLNPAAIKSVKMNVSTYCVQSINFIFEKDSFIRLPTLHWKASEPYLSVGFKAFMREAETHLQPEELEDPPMSLARILNMYLRENDD